MVKLKTIGAFGALLLTSSFCVAVEPGQTLVEPNEVLPIWPGPAPGSENALQVEKETLFPAGGFTVVRNVTEPTISVYLPPEEKVTGTAVVIAPGGGFWFLTTGKEGHDVAHWLAQRGIAGIVLKYRTVESPADDAEMWVAFMQSMGDKAKSGSPDFMEESRLAVADGLQAMRLVRERATGWGLRPDRIGFLGFSAGAMIASHVALATSGELRPDFVAPIYGAPFGDIPPIPSDLPPIFLAHSSDDVVVAESVQVFYSALRQAGHQPELHIYHGGGHGYGIEKQGKSSDFWIKNYFNWLAALGFTQPADSQ
jgi:acetyl esterase/lipase